MFHIFMISFVGDAGSVHSSRNTSFRTQSPGVGHVIRSSAKTSCLNQPARLQVTGNFRRQVPCADEGRPKPLPSAGCVVTGDSADQVGAGHCCAGGAWRPLLVCDDSARLFSGSAKGRAEQPTMALTSPRCRCPLPKRASRVIQSI